MDRDNFTDCPLPELHELELGPFSENSLRTSVTNLEAMKPHKFCRDDGSSGLVLDYIVLQIDKLLYKSRKNRWILTLRDFSLDKEVMLAGQDLLSAK